MSVTAAAAALAALRPWWPEADGWMPRVAEAQRNYIRELTATPSATRAELEAKKRAILILALDGDHEDLWPDLLISFARDHVRLDRRRRMRHAPVSEASEDTCRPTASVSCAS